MIRTVSCALAFALLTTGALAQAFPSKPITLIVPLAPGSTADIASRNIGNELAKALGQTVVVDNRPGAGGTIAMGQVARAAPDGHTLAFISQGTHAFNPALYAKIDYDPVKDFAPITPLASVSNVMIVHPTDPAKAPLDLVARAKAKPGEVNFSSGGSGTSHHISGVLFGQLTGTNIVHVPYRGAPQGIMAVMSGEVPLGFFNTPTVISQIKDGKLKPLAVTSLTRSSHLPDLPTLDEAGIKGYDMVTWFGFALPAGTPAAIVERYHAEISKIAKDKDLRAKLEAQGFDFMEQVSPAKFADFIKAEVAKWGPIVKASGAKSD
ncbi:MAG: tripartite tricarboxylate transporter substrate binding protein [Alphaproteobacteria bacterium]|nr:tripartite tricarboxylate transporter substrate binding protein [Alphaproteobacteria bacterium]